MAPASGMVRFPRDHGRRYREVARCRVGIFLGEVRRWFARRTLGWHLLLYRGHRWTHVLANSLGRLDLIGH